jgi:hypothetical protein
LTNVISLTEKQIEAATVHWLHNQMNMYEYVSEECDGRPLPDVYWAMKTLLDHLRGDEEPIWVYEEEDEVD